MKQSLDSLSRVRIPHAKEYYDLLQYESDPIGGYRLSRPQALPHITINNDGYRGNPFTGRERILLLGDSVTFGVGASSDEARFARFFEFAAGQPVADASVRAYRVLQQFGRLPVLLGRLPRVEMTLLWCGYADLLYWVLSGGSIEGAFGFAQKYAAAKPEGFVTRMLKRPAPAVSVRIKPQSLEALVDQMITYVRAIQDLLVAREIQFRVLLQPFVRTRPISQSLREICDGYDEKTREKVGKGWYDLCGEFIPLIERGLEWAVPGRWIECQPLLSEDDFLDQVHLKESAANRLARDLARKLFHQRVPVP